MAPPNSASVSHQFLCFFSVFLYFHRDSCFLCSCSILRRHDFLAVAPKKSVAIQARRGPSPDVVPISGRSGADVAASSVGQAPPVPSAGQADAGAKGAPSEVAEQTVAEVIPLPMSELTELPLAFVAPSVVGAALQVEGPAS